MTPEIVDKIHDMDLSDRKFKLRELVKATGISHERMLFIFYSELGMKKLSARWVPRLLNEEQKHICVRTSEDNSALFKRNPTDFLRRFVVMDEHLDLPLYTGNKKSVKTVGTTW